MAAAQQGVGVVDAATGQGQEDDVRQTCTTRRSGSEQQEWWMGEGCPENFWGFSGDRQDEKKAEAAAGVAAGARGGGSGGSGAVVTVGPVIDF
ncbi:hypothetical protein PT974_08679 [Cladobotryum mycophilum]|uniref:Uncharacterized protein n=1 Tax=Cladobotryum mycophilum TaxID=491253 RepID=A0ABR0SFF0_9HYPO